MSEDEEEGNDPVLEPSNTSIVPDAIRLVYKITDKDVGTTSITYLKEHGRTVEVRTLTESAIVTVSYTHLRAHET